ncbi:MAG: hypothetical protein J6X55_03310 [Victivallales bacterium]|nr:hypothetical protein [Victivallales bacterium]
MKRRLIATILALLVISFKGTAGFMDALSQKVNDAAKAIGGAVTGQETNEDENQEQNAPKTVFDKYKDDPSFIFPNRDVCDSEIPLYKTYKSGMNKKCISEKNLTFSTKISVDEKSTNACFVSTANNYGNNRNPYNDKTEVDFYFAHKNANDPIGVLVQDCVTLRSPDVEFDDIVNKYSKQLGIESPNTTQKVLKNDKLRNDLRMELARYQLLEKTCILESNGLKVVVMAHDINVTFNDEAKELVNRSDRKIIITKLKMSVDSKAKTIVIVDTKQMEAYHQLYLKEKMAEEELEKQRKNESKNKQLDF